VTFLVVCVAAELRGANQLHDGIVAQHSFPPSSHSQIQQGVQSSRTSH